MALMSSFSKQYTGLSPLLEDVAEHLQIGLFADLVHDNFYTYHHTLSSNVSDKGTLCFLLHSSELP